MIKPAAETSVGSGRIDSIDALRGFDMFFIIGGASLMRAVSQIAQQSRDNNPFVHWFAGLENQLEHVPWHGFHFYDLIFPLFLFLVGCVLPLSLGNQQGSVGYGRILRRTFALVGLGLIYNGALDLRFVSWTDSRLVWDWSTIRFPGVLQRIGICYLFGALAVAHLSTSGRIALTIILLAGYDALLRFVAAPGGTPGDYSLEGNLAGWVDRQVFGSGKMYYSTGLSRLGDNEGVLSTLPALATVLCGALAGQWLSSGASAVVKVFALAAVGAAAVVLGEQWSRQFGSPINKILWTSPFVLVAGGYSTLLLAGFYFLIDVCGLRSWSYFFRVVGANAVTIYMLKEIVDFEHAARFFVGGAMDRLGGPELSSPWQLVMLWSAVLALEWLCLWFLYRHRVFLRV